MAIVALRCPQCGGELEMEDSREFGFCQFCGTKMMIQEYITQKMDVRLEIDNSPKMEQLIKLAYNEWKSGDLQSAREHVIKALEADASNVQGWMLRSILEGKMYSDHVNSDFTDDDRALAINIMFSDINKTTLLKHYFTDEPELNVIAVVIESFLRIKQAYEGDRLLLEIYEDELLTGFERICNEQIGMVNIMLDGIDRIRNYNELTMKRFEQSGMDAYLEDKKSFFMSLLDKITTPSIGVRTMEKRIFMPKYTYNGEKRSSKIFIGDYSVKEMKFDVGVHEISDGDRRKIILLVPKMPDASIIDSVKNVHGDDKIIDPGMIREGRYILKEPHTCRHYRLIEYPKWEIKVLQREEKSES